MAEALELKAWTRARTGKGGARASRREGRIPGILYGDKSTPEIIDVDYRAITQQLHTGHFQSTIFILDFDGSQDARHPPPGAARSHSRLSHPCRFHARGRAFAGHRRGSGALPERSRLPRHQARRHLEHRAPRNSGPLPGRRHPRAFRCGSDRSRDRRQRAHLGDQAAGRREARPSPSAISPWRPSSAAPLRKLRLPPPLLPQSLALRKLPPLRPRPLQRKTRTRRRRRRRTSLLRLLAASVLSVGMRDEALCRPRQSGR